MNITFKQESPTRVLILSGEKVIGHVFTPAGSGDNVLNAVQVCGFEEAYSLWGCGVFGERLGQESYGGPLLFRAKQDIQLRFSDYDWSHGVSQEDGIRNCSKCYSKPCACEGLFVKAEHGNVENRLEYKDGKKPLWGGEVGQQSDRQEPKYSVEEWKKLQSAFHFESEDGYGDGCLDDNDACDRICIHAFDKWLKNPDKVREILDKEER